MPAGPDDPDFVHQCSQTTSKAETLIYLIEIIDELKVMAERSGYRTLAAILNAALTEARIQSEEKGR